MDDPFSGRMLQGRYRVGDKIAAGGMGVVYRGERVQLGRPVAIKFLRAFAAADPQILKRFEIEARATSRLSHPNCVAILDFGVDDAIPYLVLDYVTGVPVRSLMGKGPVAPGRALHITRQLLAGLAHAHGQGIIHRDIKPDNILLGEATGVGLQVRILDFGVAKLLDAGGNSLTQGFAIGTPSYMSPEQTLSEPVDARSDLYSVGILLFEMLSGQKPFLGDDLAETLRLQRHVTAPLLRTVAPARSAGLEAVIARALAKAPADRYQSAAEMSRALDATPEAMANPVVAGALPPSETVELSAADVLPAPRRRWPWLAVAFATVVLAPTVWLLLREPPAESPPVATPPPVEPPSVEPIAAAPAPPPADAPPELVEVEALIQAKKWSAAVKQLEVLRRRYRDNAYIPYLLGNLYMEKLWGQEAFAAYAEAVHKNPAYRRDPVLIRNVIRSFVSDTHAWRGVSFIREEIGVAAVPYLEEVKNSRVTPIRTYANRLLAQLKH